MNQAHGSTLSMDLVRRRQAGREGAAARLAQHPFIQAQSVELIERLELINLKPQTIVSLDIGGGGISHALSRRYPQAAIHDIAPWENVRDLNPLRRVMRSISRAPRRTTWVAAADAVPFPDDSVDLVCANLVFCWYALPGVFAEMQRVLKPEGLLIFSLPGSQTLVELREAWLTQTGAANRVHDFADVAAIGDALSKAGFHDIVVDVDRHRIAVTQGTDLVSRLRDLGLQNARVDRPRGLVGTAQWRSFLATLDRFLVTDRDRAAVTVEVVFGHAWAPHRRGVMVSLT